MLLCCVLGVGFYYNLSLSLGPMYQFLNGLLWKIEGIIFLYIKFGKKYKWQQYDNNDKINDDWILFSIWIGAQRIEQSC